MRGKSDRKKKMRVYKLLPSFNAVQGAGFASQRDNQWADYMNTTIFSPEQEAEWRGRTTIAWEAEDPDSSPWISILETCLVILEQSLYL